MRKRWRGVVRHILARLGLCASGIDIDDLVAVLEVGVLEIGLVVPSFEKGFVSCSGHSGVVVDELLSFLLVHIDHVQPELERKAH